MSCTGWRLWRHPPVSQAPACCCVLSEHCEQVPVFTISHVLTAGKPQTRNKWINFTKHFICPISYSCLRQSGLWMRPHWPQTHTWRLVHRHLRCWRHCSQLTFTKVSAHFCFLIFRLSIFCPCPKKYDFKWLKNDLLTRIVINQTVWMLWILLVESGGWCGMGCVCIARCCREWRMSGQEMTFDCIMSPLTTNTAGSSAAATWGQLLRRRCSCWWSPDSSEDHRDLSGTEHLLKIGFILR